MMAQTVLFWASHNLFTVAVHAGNLTGGNTDLSQELFVIRADGTGLRQMTSSTGELGGIWDPMIAGAGAKIVFDTREFLLPGANGITQVYVIKWEGTGLRRVTNVGQPALDGANHPSVTDDGVTVVYASDRKTTGNPEGNSEIWKNRTDVSAEVRLTNTATGNFYPEISGGGGRIAFAPTVPSARSISMVVPRSS